jgi:hypothetical protein
MTSEAQKKAVKKFKEKVKRMTIEFHPSEMELYEHIQKQSKKQTYIKDMIRADMNEPDYKTILGEVLLMVKHGEPRIRTVGFIEDKLNK